MFCLRRVETETPFLRTPYASPPLFCEHPDYTQKFALTRPLYSSIAFHQKTARCVPAPRRRACWTSRATRTRPASWTEQTSCRRTERRTGRRRPARTSTNMRTTSPGRTGSARSLRYAVWPARRWELAAEGGILNERTTGLSPCIFPSDGAFAERGTEHLGDKSPPITPSPIQCRITCQKTE